MKLHYRTLLGTGVFLLIGAFFSFLLLARTEDLYKATWIGYVYALCFIAAFWIVHRLIAPKFTVFSTARQWLLRSMIYTIAFSAAYVAGLVFQTIVLLPTAAMEKFAIQHLWRGLVNLVTLPFQRGEPPSFFDPALRTVFIPFLAMLFLIGLVSLVGSFIELRWQESRRQSALQQAELMALRAQIEPHFLFNSLNTIASLIHTQPEQAERLIVQLSRLLRYLFQSTARETVELSREIEFTRQYVELLQARFGDKMKVRWEQSVANLNHPVPVLILQPLIENAIQHGWEDRSKPLQLTIAMVEIGQAIRISVADDGKGISRQQLAKLPTPGHALANISERLSLMFRKDNLLQIDSSENGGTEVTLTIPVKSV